MNQETTEIYLRVKDGPKPLKLVDINQLSFNKPTVCCISGNGAVTPESAYGFARMAETYLELLFRTKDGCNVLDNVDVMTIKYAKPEGIVTGGYISDSFSEQFANALLKLLTDANGNKLNLETAKKNMSKITFFTYCAGDINLQNILSRFLDKKLLNIGYSEEEIVTIYNASFNVSYASVSSCQNKIPSVKAVSLNDSLIGQDVYNYLLEDVWDDSRRDAIYHSIDGIFLHKDQAGTLYGHLSKSATAESIQILSSGLNNAYPEKVCDHNIAYLARNKKNWKLRTCVINGDKYYSNNADCVSELLAWALCRGVEGSVNNFKAQEYIPNHYWKDLTSEFKSIIHSYDQEKLARNPVYEEKLCKKFFGNLKKKYQKFYHIPSYQKMLDTINNANSLEAIIDYIKGKYFAGIEYVLPAAQVLTNNEKTKILKAGKDKLLDEIKLEK